jgi:hypothetical protein
MLKNKYVAIVLTILAIILVTNTILNLNKKGNQRKTVKQLPLPNQPPLPMNQPEKQIINTSSEQQTKTIQKTEDRSFSPYNPLVKKEKHFLNPSSLIWGNDPFGPIDNLISKNNDREDFQKVFLSAIIIRKNRKFAIINNIVFKEGDLKGGILLKRIENSYIIIVVKNKEITLKIFEKKEIPLIEENKGSD